MFDICRGEERRRKERMMSICLTWVPSSELGEPNIYHNLDHFTRMCGDFTWRVVNMDLIVEVRTNKPSTLTDCFTSP